MVKAALIKAAARSSPEPERDCKWPADLKCHSPATMDRENNSDHQYHSKQKQSVPRASIYTKILEK
eukprot:2572171-Amphidinium_carterae.1